MLKLECFQPIGAFKIRGAANAIARLSGERKARGVVCCSTGNHGRAVAAVAASSGIRAVVCLSSLVPETKVRAIESSARRCDVSGARKTTRRRNRTGWWRRRG